MINNELEPEKIQSKTIVIASIVLICLVLLLINLVKPFITSPQISEDEVQYIQDEIIVQFKGETEPKLIKVPIGQVEAEVERYQQMDNVEYVEPNYIVRGMFAPNDPLYPTQWNLGDPEQGGIEMEPAWDISTGKRVVVAVVDTGIAYEAHTSADGTKYAQAPDLANTCFAPGYDFVNQDEHPNDDHGHGTHVAGTIAQSTNNGIGVAGVAYDACLMPIKVLDGDNGGTVYDMGAGVHWAVDHGAQVINMSLGFCSYSQYAHDSVKYAYNHGAVIVAASGNNSGYVTYPAAFNDYVIAVGATKHDKTRASYSNYGPSLDLVAPGSGIVQNTFLNNNLVDHFSYRAFSGTSMATPHVSGVAALLIADHNVITPDQIQTILETTAIDLGAHGRDDYYGWGLINARRALGYKPSIDIIITPQKQDVYPEASYPDNIAVYDIQLIPGGNYETMDVTLSTIPELTDNIFISSSIFSSPDFGTGMPLSIHLEDSDDTTYNMTLIITTGPQAPSEPKVVSFQVKAEGVAESGNKESEQSFSTDIEATSPPVILNIVKKEFGIIITPQKQDVYPEASYPDNIAVYDIQLIPGGEYTTMDIELSTVPELANNPFISSSIFSSPDFGTGMPLSIHLEDSDDTTYNITLTITTGPQIPPATKVVNFQVKADGVAKIDNNEEPEQSSSTDIEATSPPVILKMIPSVEREFILIINDPKAVSVIGGETATYQITVIRNDDFEGVVDLSVPELVQYSVFNDYLDNIYISENPVGFTGLAGQSKVVDMTIQTNELPANLQEIDLPFTVVGSNPNLPKETCEDKGLLCITNPFYVDEENRNEAKMWEFPARKIDICAYLTAICHNPAFNIIARPIFSGPDGGWLDPLALRDCRYDIPKVIKEMFIGFTLINREIKSPMIMSERNKRIYEKLRRSEENINEIISNLRQQLMDSKDN